MTFVCFSQVKELRESQRREREALSQEHSQQAATLQALLEEKTEEVGLSLEVRMTFWFHGRSPPSSASLLASTVL